MIRVCFLWHMHQPFYKDLISGEYRMQWTRMHALKDYFGMVEILGEFPDVRATFNLVPSLMVQIEEYASGKAREGVLNLVLKPAESLTRDERITVLTQLFQANPERLIARYPRYWELYEIYRSVGFSPDRAVGMFSNRDFTDLQVLSQLAWFDEYFLENDAEIRGLVSKRAGYSAADQQTIGRKERELTGRIVDAYRRAQERGQAELTTTPFYHPILPLLCDTQVAEESRPGIRLPRRFRHPEDARLQLERAIAQHVRLFGRRPAGLWPSEGSVSDEVLGMAAELGFRWAATGEGVLARSIGSSFHRDGAGVPANAASLYASYQAAAPGSAPIRMFFRDHNLSDLIGFVYSKMEPHDAARDLLERLRRCGRAAYSGASDPVISVILDGENAWEYYARSGRDFFRALYRGFSEDRELKAVTFSDTLVLPPRSRITHTVPGSWINANFDIWIGAEEDNRAWDLLADARDFFSQAERQRPQGVTDGQMEIAREELLIAEGSDWNWWYGPEHHSANDRQFDQLYRSHLANVYRALGAQPPDALAVPIAREQLPAFSTPPGNYIHPKIDGYVTSYFEWMGAGLYSLDQRTAAMHGKRFYLREVRYGLDAGNFYLQLELNPEGAEAIERSEIRVNFMRDKTTTGLVARVTGQGAKNAVSLEVHSPAGDGVKPSAADAEAAFQRVFEMRASLAALGLNSTDKFRFQVILWEAGLPVDLIPAEGWLEVETAEPLQER